MNAIIERRLLTDLQRFDVGFREETGFADLNYCTIPPITASLRGIGKENKVLSKSYATCEWKVREGFNRIN
jgi:hypothetical protein